MAEKPKTAAKKAESRTYFRMSCSLTGGFGPSIEVAASVSPLRSGHFSARGFKELKMGPVPFIFGRVEGQLPRDLEEYQGTWLTSDRMKTVLQTVDPQGFAFVECDIRLKDGEPGPQYWLCDVLRVLDVVDERDPSVITTMYLGEKTFSFTRLGHEPLNLKDLVGSESHVFRLSHEIYTVVADGLVRKACEDAHLKGISFKSIT